MRKKLSVLLIIALLIYVLRAQMLEFFGSDIGKVSFLGIPILTEWSSIGLLLIFGLDLIVSVYGSFLHVPHLSMRIRDEERETWKTALPVTITRNNIASGQASLRILHLKVHNKGPVIAEGCRAFCKLLKDKTSIEIRWRMIPPPFGAVQPLVEESTIPQAIQDLFETGPADLVPYIETALTVAFTIDGVTTGAYLMGAHHYHALGNFPVQEDVELSVTGKNVTKPIFTKFRMRLNSPAEIELKRLTSVLLLSDFFSRHFG